MIKRFEVKTTAAAQMIDITAQVKGLVRAQNMSAGMIVVYVPHTTCAVTINENADPDVKEDIIENLERLVPSGGRYKHTEGNSHAHIKASLVGSSVNIFVESSTLVLGTWQGVYLWEHRSSQHRRSVVIHVGG